MAKKKLSQRIEAEINRLSSEYGYDQQVLNDFAQLVLQKEKAQTKEPAKSKGTAKSKTAKTKPLTLPQLKEAIYKHFKVQDTTALKKSGTFRMATSGMGQIDLSKKLGWEEIYRKIIGILPGEDEEQGYGCVNGINIFKYDLPWRAFGLEPKTSTTDDVKAAYRELSKVYHPDNSKTGDANIFDRLTVFYKSLTERI